MSTAAPGASILPVVEPFITRVHGILSGGGRGADPADLRAELKALLAETRGRPAPEGLRVSPAEWDSLQRTLVFWADEVITDKIPAWENYTLEQSFYDVKLRASEFYKNAESAASAGSRACAEVEFLAAVLGFRGDPVDTYRLDLKREPPGGRQERDAAVKAFAGDRLRRALATATKGPEGRRLDGDRRPLSGGRLLPAAAAAAVVCGLVMLVMLAWRTGFASRLAGDGG